MGIFNKLANLSPEGFSRGLSSGFQMGSQIRRGMERREQQESIQAARESTQDRQARNEIRTMFENSPEQALARARRMGLDDLVDELTEAQRTGTTRFAAEAGEELEATQEELRGVDITQPKQVQRAQERAGKTSRGYGRQLARTRERARQIPGAEITAGEPQGTGFAQPGAIQQAEQQGGFVPARRRTADIGLEPVYPGEHALRRARAKQSELNEFAGQLSGLSRTAVDLINDPYAQDWDAKQERLRDGMEKAGYDDGQVQATITRISNRRQGKIQEDALSMLPALESAGDVTELVKRYGDYFDPPTALVVESRKQFLREEQADEEEEDYRRSMAKFEEKLTIAQGIAPADHEKAVGMVIDEGEKIGLDLTEETAASLVFTGPDPNELYYKALQSYADPYEGDLRAIAAAKDLGMKVGSDPTQEDKIRIGHAWVESVTGQPFTLPGGVEVEAPAGSTADAVKGLQTLVAGYRQNGMSEEETRQAGKDYIMQLGSVERETSIALDRELQRLLPMEEHWLRDVNDKGYDYYRQRLTDPGSTWAEARRQRYGPVGTEIPEPSLFERAMPPRVRPDFMRRALPGRRDSIQQNRQGANKEFLRSLLERQS